MSLVTCRSVCSPRLPGLYFVDCYSTKIAYLPLCVNVCVQVWGKPQGAKDRRLSTVRCAELMAISMCNGLEEVWICLQPVLAMVYMSQYAPDTCRWYVMTHLHHAPTNQHVIIHTAETHIIMFWTNITLPIITCLGFL